MKEEFKSALFALAMTILTLAILFAFMLIGYEILKDEPTKQPTVKCIDGKLYDVSYEGRRCTCK